jgi:hypothetical protein
LQGADCVYLFSAINLPFLAILKSWASRQEMTPRSHAT